MRIQVRLFSLLRERAGASQVPLEVPPGATVEAAVRRLGEDVTPIAGLLDGREGLPLSFAVNRVYVQPDRRLAEGDELAVFPPVSGGAPLDKGLLLLSGGFDSPVAGALVRAGGRELDAIHFTMEPFTDDASARKAHVLAHMIGLRRLTVVPLGTDLAEFTRNCDHRFYFVLLKRLMLRVAQEIAAGTGATFLVTGENLGQVSSQTLANLSAIDEAAAIPVLRPLLGLDKNDIIDHARRLGTYETSCGPELCDVLGPAHPTTAADVAEVRRQEARVDVRALVAHAVGASFVVATDDPTSLPALEAEGCAPVAVALTAGPAGRKRKKAQR